MDINKIKLKDLNDVGVLSAKRLNTKKTSYKCVVCNENGYFNIDLTSLRNSGVSTGNNIITCSKHGDKLISLSETLQSVFKVDKYRISNFLAGRYAEIEQEQEYTNKKLSLNKEQLKEQKENVLNELNDVIVDNKEEETKEMEIEKMEWKFDPNVKHYQFERLKKLVKLNINTLLVGGAGTGKNFNAELVAKELDLDFYPAQKITQDFQVQGFIDGAGKFHETSFYKAFTQGGLFFLDEMDASDGNALIIINGALANGYFDFPNGRQNAHENFRFVAGANTFGHGADTNYGGRNVLDGATLDRFAVLEWDYDKKVEYNLSQGNIIWADFVRIIRSIAKANDIEYIFSTRAIIMGAKMLAEGFSPKETAKIVVFKGLQKENKNQIRETFNEWVEENKILDENKKVHTELINFFKKL